MNIFEIGCWSIDGARTTSFITSDSKSNEDFSQDYDLAIKNASDEIICSDNEFIGFGNIVSLATSILIRNFGYIPMAIDKSIIISEIEIPITEDLNGYNKRWVSEFLSHIGNDRMLEIMKHNEKIIEAL